MDSAFMDAFSFFFFQANQTALVREQLLSLRLHEWLHGTVMADHRLTLQRGDSSWHTDPRGHTEVATVKDGLWSSRAHTHERAACALSPRSPACQ